MTRTAIAEPTLHAYIDGWLSPEQRAQVEAHLLLCATETARVRAYQAQRETIKAHAGGGQDDVLPSYLVQSVVCAPLRRRWRWSRSATVLFVLGVLLGWGAQQAVQALHAVMPRTALAIVSNENRTRAQTNTGATYLFPDSKDVHVSRGFSSQH